MQIRIIQQVFQICKKIIKQKQTLSYSLSLRFFRDFRLLGEKSRVSSESMSDSFAVELLAQSATPENNKKNFFRDQIHDSRLLAKFGVTF